jgi:uncharacterized protein (DUF169 family)
MVGETPRRSDGGQLGVKFGLFQEGRANLRHRTYVPKLDNGSVNYVVYSPIDKLQFEPDLLVFVVTPRQAEILLRAMSYSTGELFESRGTLVGNCASLYIYPYLTGKVNYMVMGLAYGMNGRQVFPDGVIILSVPYQWIPIMTENLKEMDIIPPGYKIDNREKFIKWDADMTEQNARESENP